MTIQCFFIFGTTDIYIHIRILIDIIDVIPVTTICANNFLGAIFIVYRLSIGIGGPFIQPAKQTVV